jgi:hypothetical protein
MLWGIPGACEADQRHRLGNTLRMKGSGAGPTRQGGKVIAVGFAVVVVHSRADVVGSVFLFHLPLQQVWIHDECILFSC